MTRPASLWTTLEWIRRSAVVTSSDPPCPHLLGARPWAFGFGSGALVSQLLPFLCLRSIYRAQRNEQILLCRAPANRHSRRYARCQLRSSTSDGTAATTATNQPILQVPAGACEGLQIYWQQKRV